MVKGVVIEGYKMNFARGIVYMKLQIRKYICALFVFISTFMTVYFMSSRIIKKKMIIRPLCNRKHILNVNNKQHRFFSSMTNEKENVTNP